MAFDGKVILITGGNSGIGADCAEYFAKEGALLALVGRRAEKFESVLEKIKENGVEAEPLVIVADVSVDAERIISETIEKYGRLDILINNAGIFLYDTLETMKMEDYDSIMATNVRGAVELTKLAMPHLIESKGNVVNVSSIAGLLAGYKSMAYSLSKACLDQFTKCTAMEFASKGVRVNAINPGLIVTDIHVSAGVPEDQLDNYYGKLKARTPLEILGDVNETTNAIAFLANDNARFITGVILRVDGGISTRGVL